MKHSLRAHAECCSRARISLFESAASFMIHKHRLIHQLLGYQLTNNVQSYLCKCTTLLL